MSTAGSFNPELAKLARQARGYSQIDLAKHSGLTQAAVSKLENGLIPPSDDALEKLASALRFPKSFFLQSDRVFGLPVSVQYRKKASAGQKVVDRLEAEINLGLFRLRRLISSIELHPEMPLPSLDVDEYGGSGEAVAAMLRRIWLVPSGPVRNLVHLAERAGCIVFSCNFQSLGVDGLTLQPSGLPTCIFLNNQMPGDRQRFTLAHELGHAVMHRVPTPNMEREADDFAAALLMPADEVRSQLTGLTLQRLASLKPVWRVSMGALLYRAKTVGAISDSQSAYLWRQMSKLGYRVREPEELRLAPEEPTVLPEVVNLHLNQLGYSVEELAVALSLHAEELVELYGLKPALPAASTAPKLSIVR